MAPVRTSKQTRVHQDANPFFSSPYYSPDWNTSLLPWDAIAPSDVVYSFDPLLDHYGLMGSFSGHPVEPSLDPYSNGDYSATQNWESGILPSEADFLWSTDPDALFPPGPEDPSSAPTPSLAASTSSSSTDTTITPDKDCVPLPTVPPVPSFHAIKDPSPSPSPAPPSSALSEATWAALREAHIPKPSGTKSFKVKKPKGDPKPPNSFFLYRPSQAEQFRKEREYLLETNGVRVRGPSQSDFSKVTALKWNSLAPEEKIFWKEMADEEKKRHRGMYPNYRHPSRKAEVKQRKRAVNGGAVPPAPSIL